jgi:hypothetical protein
MYAKDIKELRKTEKRKEENKIKMEKGLGDPIQPSSASGPRPTRRKSQKGILFLSSTNDRWDPPVGFILSNSFFILSDN